METWWQIKINLQMSSNKLNERTEETLLQFEKANKAIGIFLSKAHLFNYIYTMCILFCATLSIVMTGCERDDDVTASMSQTNNNNSTGGISKMWVDYDGQVLRQFEFEYLNGRIVKIHEIDERGDADLEIQYGSDGKLTKMKDNSGDEYLFYFTGNPVSCFWRKIVYDDGDEREYGPYYFEYDNSGKICKMTAQSVNDEYDMLYYASVTFLWSGDNIIQVTYYDSLSYGSMPGALVKCMVETSQYDYSYDLQLNNPFEDEFMFYLSFMGVCLQGLDEISTGLFLPYQLSKNFITSVEFQSNYKKIPLDSDQAIENSTTRWNTRFDVRETVNGYPKTYYACELIWDPEYEDPGDVGGVRFFTNDLGVFNQGINDEMMRNSKLKYHIEYR